MATECHHPLKSFSGAFPARATPAGDLTQFAWRRAGVVS